MVMEPNVEDGLKVGALPPGPSLPMFAQQANWVLRPTQFMEACARKYGDAFTLRMSNLANMVFVAHPDMVRDVFTGDPAVFHAGEANAITRPLVGSRSVLVLDEAPHHRERKLLMPPFHGDRMQAYATVMRDEAAREAASWEQGTAFPIHRSFQRISLEVILRAVFGLRDARRLEDSVTTWSRSSRSAGNPGSSS
jgi:cytochrome P450 family 135